MCKCKIQPKIAINCELASLWKSVDRKWHKSALTTERSLELTLGHFSVERILYEISNTQLLCDFCINSTFTKYSSCIYYLNLSCKFLLDVSLYPFFLPKSLERYKIFANTYRKKILARNIVLNLISSQKERKQIRVVANCKKKCVGKNWHAEALTTERRNREVGQFLPRALFFMQVSQLKKFLSFFFPTNI